MSADKASVKGRNIELIPIEVHKILQSINQDIMRASQQGLNHTIHVLKKNFPDIVSPHSAKEFCNSVYCAVLCVLQCKGYTIKTPDGNIFISWKSRKSKLMDREEKRIFDYYKSKSKSKVKDLSQEVPAPDFRRYLKILGMEHEVSDVVKKNRRIKYKKRRHQIIRSQRSHRSHYNHSGQHSHKDDVIMKI